MSGIIRSVLGDAGDQAAELEAKAVALRLQASQYEHDAALLRTLVAVAGTWKPRLVDPKPEEPV